MNIYGTKNSNEEKRKGMRMSIYLQNKMVLYLLLIGNIIGTIYGYVWYGWQLSTTSFPLVLFVPDSPTASLFFCFVLLLFILGTQSGLIEALAVLSLVKYGVWAVIMNLLVLILQGDLHWTGYMLMASHGFMAIQGLAYFSFYRIKLWHWAVGALWLLHNDFLDYVFAIMPYYEVIQDYPKEIGYFTFWLSIFVIVGCYVFYEKTTKKQLKLW